MADANRKMAFVEEADVETQVFDWGKLGGLSEPRVTPAEKFSAGVVQLELRTARRLALPRCAGAGVVRYLRVLADGRDRDEGLVKLQPLDDLVRVLDGCLVVKRLVRRIEPVHLVDDRLGDGLRSAARRNRSSHASCGTTR